MITLGAFLAVAVPIVFGLIIVVLGGIALAVLIPAARRRVAEDVARAAADGSVQPPQPPAVP